MGTIISLANLSFILPDSRLLLDNLTESFGEEPAALVGRNGTGKTVLAKIMAGHLPPSSGNVIRTGRVRYVDQMIDPSQFSTVARLTETEEILDILKRIEEGHFSSADLEAAEGNWDLRERLSRELHLAKLDYLDPETPASRLSGGECTRLSLVGAFLSGADFLILDEPTNHLDHRNKRALLEHLQSWKKGLLVISHDREVLSRVPRIVELAQGKLRSYGGNYDVYLEARDLQRRAALDHLEHLKTERKRAGARQRETLERQQHRTSGGHKKAPSRGIPKIALHAMRGNAEKTEGKIASSGKEKTALLAAQEKEASLEIPREDPVVLIPPLCTVPPGKIVFRLEEVLLPWGTHRNPLNWTLRGPERVALTGANGSGKTTLLRILKGEIAPLSGRCEMMVPFATLNQFTALPPEKSPLECLREANPALSRGDAGTRLAQIGIVRERLELPAKVLSGGEQLKAALLLALHASPPPRLLLLDEPTNHLDLNSVESVETMLKGYSGALVVISHDSWFLERLGVTKKMELYGENP